MGWRAQSGICHVTLSEIYCWPVPVNGASGLRETMHLELLPQWREHFSNSTQASNCAIPEYLILSTLASVRWAHAAAEEQTRGIGARARIMNCITFDPPREIEGRDVGRTAASDEEARNSREPFHPVQSWLLANFGY